MRFQTKLLQKEVCTAKSADLFVQLFLFCTQIVQQDINTQKQHNSPYQYGVHYAKGNLAIKEIEIAVDGIL